VEIERGPLSLPTPLTDLSFDAFDLDTLDVRVLKQAQHRLHVVVERLDDFLLKPVETCPEIGEF
jgi:hypothetical protein